RHTRFSRDWSSDVCSSDLRGKEFGVNTGRKRRVGWFDAMLVRQTVRTCGIAGLALTKLDILDGFDSIRVCIGYKLDGKEIDHLRSEERRGGKECRSGGSRR